MLLSASRSRAEIPLVMRRALLVASLVMAANCLQPGVSAETIYRAANQTRTQGGASTNYYGITTYDTDSGVVNDIFESGFGLLERNTDRAGVRTYGVVDSMVTPQPLFVDQKPVFMFKDWSGDFKLYSLELSTGQFEASAAPSRFDFNYAFSANDVVVHQNIDANKVAIGNNKTAINNNRNAIRNNKKAIDTNRTNINNLGDGIAASTALGAALSALPVTPDDAPFSCGVGSGAYSSRFAMGLGCVAKLNQRLSLNAGGSHVFGGSSNYGGGSLDSVAWRGGFVLKLGKLDSPAAANEQLQSQLNEVKQENASIKEENAAIKAKYSTIEEQNAVITQQNKALMARLERLEAIALGQQPAATTASLK